MLSGPNVPIISVAISDKAGSPSVAIDDEQAAYDATRHLLRLGHRRIGPLAGDPASIYVAQPRKRGYLRAMTEAKCTPVTATGSFFYESGATGVDELLQQEPVLTAIFAVSDEMGAAVVNELQRRGLQVPEDVSVLGFDNLDVPAREPAAEHHGAAARGHGTDGGQEAAPHPRPRPQAPTDGSPLRVVPFIAEVPGQLLVRAVSMTVLVSIFSSPSGPLSDSPLLRHPHQFAGSVGLGRFCLVVNSFGTRHSLKCCGHIGLLPVRLTARRVEPDRPLFPQSRLDRCRRQGNLRDRLPDHVERPDPVAERVDAGLAGREGGGGGLAARLARKGGRRRHPVSPSASFYAPAVVLSPQGAGP